MKGIITSAALLLSSSVYGTTAGQAPIASAIPQIANSTQTAAVVVAISSTTSFNDNTGVAAYVKQQYAGEPLLIDIARCESADRQYDKSGDVLHGTVDNQDIGVMQINEQYQGAKAAAMGYDIDTVEGNVAYAQYLYDTQGAQPWSASSPCWSKAYAASQAANAIAVK